MKSLEATFAAINAMKSEGVVEEYAVAGAMALRFWTEPVPTTVLEVLVLLPASADPLVNVEPIYRWAARLGYSTTSEHILVEDVPTQFVPSPHSLADEAIRSAATLDYSGVPVRVVRPEYMDAPSRPADAGSVRARPSPELLARLRAGKAALREQRIAMSLPDKVRQLLEMQHIQVALRARQRPLRPWERPWDVEP